VLSTALVISACDTEIIPIAPTEMAFSIYGLLDPSADTQWVRVAHFRTSIFSTPDPVDAVVTIEDLGTGRAIELIPTPFSQGSGNFGDTLFAYNYRTDEPIDFAGTYRLTTRRSDGATSTAVVNVPEDLSHLVIVVGLDQLARIPPPDYVRFPIAPGDHLAMVNTVHYPPAIVFTPSGPSDACAELPVLSIYHPGSSFRPSGPPGYLQGVLRKREVMDFPPPCDVPYERIEIRIVRAREKWPFGGSADNTHIQAVDNIENGVGFLGGIVTTWIPFDEKCVLVGPGRPNFCELFYGPDTATLIVAAINGSGFHEYAFSADANLRKEDESWSRRGTGIPSSGATTSRLTRFDRLLPGRYHVQVEGRIGPFPLYCEERTLDLGSGETSIEVRMTLPEIDQNEPVNANGCREG
jgi:hypothetical protein